MNKVNEILHNKKYKDLIEKLNKYEEDRIFCKHNIEHFLDLSRIAYIRVLEENIKCSKEVIYAIGLLHDIGRVLEYEDGTPHHIGSVALAKNLLEETDFNEIEKNLIIECIEGHRNEGNNYLAKIIYESDKLSRNCFMCNASKECKWNKEKKNLDIKY
ncbi:HD domain-containing protein [Clostridium carnis]